MKKEKSLINKKFIVGGFVLLGICLVVGFIIFRHYEKEKLNNEKENIKTYIKGNMMDAWNYEDSKVVIENNLDTAIVLNNVENWITCVTVANDSFDSLKRNNFTNVEIGKLTFSCYNGANLESYIDLNNPKGVSSNSFQESIKIYTSRGEMITESIDSAKEKLKNDYISKCQEYAFKDVFRSSENYVGKYAKFTGEVIQVQEQSGYFVLRVNVTKNEYDWYEDTILVTLLKNDFEGRILEDDIITFYGQLEELASYESIFGQEITLPQLSAKYAVLMND